MDYTTRTRADRLAFDEAKRLAFQPTEQEIAEQKAKQEQDRKDMIKQKLQAVGAERPTKITKPRALQFLVMLDARQYIWDDLEKRIDDQIELFWDLEKAFDDLILRYL